MNITHQYEISQQVNNEVFSSLLGGLEYLIQVTLIIIFLKWLFDLVTVKKKETPLSVKIFIHFFLIVFVVGSLIKIGGFLQSI